jgi:hypothetical protein
MNTSSVKEIMNLADMYAQASVNVEIAVVTGGQLNILCTSHDNIRDNLRNAVEELALEAYRLKNEIEMLRAQRNWTPFNCPCVEQCHRID